MNEEAAPFGPRFTANSPAPVDEVGTAPVEPLHVLPIPERPHSPMSVDDAPLETSFAADSPAPVDEVGIASVKHPPVPPSHARHEVPSVGD